MLESLGESHFLYDFDEFLDFNFSNFIKDDMLLVALKSKIPFFSFFVK